MKTIFKTIMAIATLAAITFNASAQESTDNYRRFQISWVAEHMTNTDPDDIKPKGANVGVIWGLSMSNYQPIFLEAGVNLGYTHMNDDKHDHKFNHMTAAIPLNVVYKICPNEKLSIAPLAGLNLKVNMLASDKYGDESLNLLSKDDMGGKEYRGNIFQLGGNLGVGANIQNFYIGWQYQVDFWKFIKVGNDKSRFNANYITMGVCF
ncbi:MAG: outer membrane beta-barrel protein [Bacteroidales bacterium]|nr:outer membrane beta-barrel protein [Candidatus Liminaster caballi]